MTSPEASSKPPEKPADAPPSSAALSDKARMKLEKQLQTQENKLQKLLAKSGEIESIEALRKVIEKETLFEPALACLKKQTQIAGESKGAIDPKSFLEKAERLEALEKVFIKNLANGNASAVVAGELHKKFTDALSPTKPAEQVAISPDAARTVVSAVPPSSEPTKTVDVSAKPASTHSPSLEILKNFRDAVLAEEKARTKTLLDAGVGAAKSEEKTPPPLSNAPAAANAEKEKSAQKQNGNGNGNRTRPTKLERVQQEAKGFEQGLPIPPAPAEVVKSSGSPDPLQRIMRKVEKSGVFKRKRGTREVAVKRGDMAVQIGRLARIFTSKEFNEKSAEERERAIRESVTLLTTNERLRHDLLSAFEQKGWLIKSDKAKPDTKKEEVENKTVPASPDVALPQPPPKPVEVPAVRVEPPKPSETEKEKSAAALLHQILTDVGRVPAGETVPRRMPDGTVTGISGKDMAAEIQKIIKTYQTLEFPKKTLKERREIVLRDIENTTSHPLLRADLERAFAAKGWLPQVIEPTKTAVETKLTEPKPSVETEPKKAEPVPSRGGGERSDLSPDSRLRPASGGQVRSDLTKPLPMPIETTPTSTPPPAPIESIKSSVEPPPKDAPATLAGNPPPKESTPATPPSTPPPVAEKMPVPEPSAKTKPSLAELIRARARGGSTPATAGLKGPLIEKVTPPPAVVPTVEKAAPIPPATPAEKTATPQPAKTGPSLAELLRERMRGGVKKEAAPIPPKPAVPSKTEAVPPKPPEVVSAPKSAEVLPAPSRGGGERSDLKSGERSDLKETPTVVETETMRKFANLAMGNEASLRHLFGGRKWDASFLAAALSNQSEDVRKKILDAVTPPLIAQNARDTLARNLFPATAEQIEYAQKEILKRAETLSAEGTREAGATLEQQKALTFENLATWSKEDLARIAAAIPDDGVWAIALQGMTTSALEKAVRAALPPERVDNFALEILTMPIKPKPEIEAKQQLIIAEAQKVLAAKAGGKTEKMAGGETKGI